MSLALRSCPSCQISLPQEAQFCLRCGVATPTDPGVPPRTGTTGVVEVQQVKRALADRYRVDRVLGEGGMATVYLAEDLKHHRKVAVKVMRPELAATLGSERFLREVEVAAQLSHPHILPMYDSGEAAGLLYYVMPYVEGQTLRERLQQEKQLPVDEALRLGREVAEALAHAHGRGIVHRDIKPANILLQSGHALVADFGIARALEGSGEALTQTGFAVGTPQYMAPEQASGDAGVDGRADVYALGAVVYEMLAGEPPFTGPSSRVIVMRSMTEQPRVLTATRAGLAPVVEAAVLKALAKSPADRYQTAEAMGGALTHSLDLSRSGASHVPVAVPAGQGPAPWQVWGLFALGSAGMLGLVYALLRRWDLPQWTLLFAVALLAIGAAVLVATGRAESRRRQGRPPEGLGEWLTWRNAAIGGGLAVALWAVVATALALQAPGTATSADRSRVAILPFENQGGAADAYFADGVADEVRGKLAQVHGLTVIASSSAGQYRATTKTPQQIARELNVGYLLIGKVRWVGAAGGPRRVQVVPELVNGTTGATTWQQTFDTDVSDVFAVQAQIATQVAAALGTQLGTQEQRALTRRPTASAAAYEVYLKGKALTSVDAGTQRLAASYFEQAVALDSGFVDAWASLASALGRVYSNGSRDPVVAARAGEALRHTLALDPNGAQGQMAAVRYYGTVAPDPARSAAAIAQALRAAPNDADVLAVAASSDMGAGNLDAGIAKLERARDLDPRSATTLSSLQQAYVFKRRYSDALSVGATARAFVPADLNLIEWQSIAYLAQGDLRGARGFIRSSIDAVNTAPAVAAFFGGYQELGWALDDTEQRLLLRLTPAAFDNDPAWWGQSLATAHWERGDKAAARAYADSALAASVPQLAAAPRDPQIRALYGLMLAYEGRTAEARAQEDTVRTGGGLQAATLANRAYVLMQFVRTSLALGDNDRALADLESLTAIPYIFTPAWLRIDPTFASLRGNPRFERLAGATQ